MPKKKLGKQQKTRGLGDVTINDFANSTSITSRLKKSTNNVTTVIKQLETETVKAWDENEDFDDDFDLVPEENEDGIVTVVLKKVLRGRNRSIQESYETEIGNNYPIDVWFLISEYIIPEDVGRFAGICRASLGVVYSAKFWFSLYKRCYQSVPTLPERLQPECLFRRYGIRTSVIRSLFHMYSPFINRLKSVTTFERHPDELKKRVCVLMWHEKQKSNWFYYFKFKQVSDSRLNGTAANSKQPDLLEMLEDVCANPDENCRILQVCCLHYVAFQPVLGLTLASVSLTLSQGFRHHCLRLVFGSGLYTYSANGWNNSNCTNVVLDPVVNVKVLDWWHPMYPHDHNITHLLNEDDT